MFRIDVMSRQPVYEQIISQVEQFVLTGILVPGSQIPSVRSLSVELSINPNTIQKAYSELDRRGLIYSVPGRGCFITENAMDILSSLKRKQIGDLEKLMYELVLAGVTREEMIKCMDNAFMLKGDKKND
ncbi:MAG: GntR family transcriptional regulator [Lachnospiraceae bacterium]|nr:GntR family transcriptional regulator [Lachnospiraceae bacterium]MBQ4068167.1 GntR family transcriptional regulator [Lachnospiraceae bacterium]